jgi:hypothetical protein|tara:strand:- start:826 stop:984 length:159 start_codon:yes stop_codon:yes gene_type:complete
MKLSQIITFSLRKSDKGLMNSLKKYAKDKNTTMSGAIRDIVRARLSRAGYDV